jgi:hypothetical protein
MFKNTPLKLLFALGVIMGSAGCTTDDVIFFEGSSPINSVKIDALTATPDGRTFRITRGTAFNYAVDIHYDYNAASFSSPLVELAGYGGSFDASGNFVRSGTCVFRSLKTQNPTTQSGDIHFTGTFTLPQTAACATSPYFAFVAFIFSSTSGTSLWSSEYYYAIN